MMYDGQTRMAVIGNQPPPPVRGRIGQALDSIIQWKHNPWKPSGQPAPAVTTGEHFFNMAKSMDPKDQARCRELCRLSAVWMEKLLVRHPDMAVATQNVPGSDNGHLKLLEFIKRFKTSDSRSYERWNFPPELKDALSSKNPWPAEVARTWLTLQKPMLDEIRTIGLMPQRSNRNLIDFDLQIGAVLKDCTEALLLNARLAAGDGNAAEALNSIRAANGIADHLSRVEIPCLYNETISTLIRLQVLGFLFSEIMPALPAGKIDVAAWEAAVQPKVSPPAEFGRLLKGEYHFGMRVFILPILADAGDSHPLPDPEEFIDVYTEMFRRKINANPSHSPKDLAHFKVTPQPSSAGLSKESRNFYEHSIHEGVESWRTGWVRAQSIHGMHQAAFAIMKGQPVPPDPIHGLPYVWDAATRTLSAPVSPAFDEMKMTPIIVPKP